MHPPSHARESVAFELRRTLDSFVSCLVWLSFPVKTQARSERAEYIKQDWRFAVEAHARALKWIAVREPSRKGKSKCVSWRG
jgi:hypothetical protein